MLTFDRWDVRELPHDTLHLAELWLKLQEYPTLFSDATREDIKNWISCVNDPSYVWYEVLEREEVIGIIYFQLLDDKADLHVAFFDRKPAEKRELIKFFCKFLFDSLPVLHKISASIPSIYFATWRLAKAVGFKWEGSLREEVVIAGRRVDVHLYGLLRHEAYGLPEESRQGSGDSLRNGHRRAGNGESPRSSTGWRIST